jgi:hypothetical protein
MGRYAICVGIDDYDNLPEGWDSLEFASADANALGDLLSDPAWGGFDRVEVLTKPAQTTLSGLIDALKRLFYDNRPEQEDTVLLYFASHCGLDSQDRLFLIPSDGHMNHWGIPDLASMLRIESIAAYFAGCQAHNLLLVLDLAYSDDRANLARRIKLGENLNFFTVGSVITTQVIDDLHMLKHSPFNYCLLKALKQPPGPDGWLQVGQVQESVARNLRQLLDTYWAEHSQLLNYASAFSDDMPLLRVMPESEEFTREVKHALQRNGYRILATSRLEKVSLSRIRAEITVALTRAVVEVLALDNSRVDWSATQAQQFIESADRLRSQGEITHVLVISKEELDPDVADALRRWHFDFLTLDDVMAQI